jgi:hypothetical protein
MTTDLRKAQFNAVAGQTTPGGETKVAAWVSAIFIPKKQVRLYLFNKQKINKVYLFYSLVVGKGGFIQGEDNFFVVITNKAKRFKLSFPDLRRLHGPGYLVIGFYSVFKGDKIHLQGNAAGAGHPPGKDLAAPPPQFQVYDIFQNALP